MKGQKNNPVAVEGFDVNAYAQLMDSDYDGFFAFLNRLSDRRHTISKAGIKLERRLLFTWKKNGLLPFRATVDADKKTWNRYSFTELSWIQVLIALRKQGVGINRLKQIKDKLFLENFHQHVLPLLSHSQLGPNLSGAFKEKGLATDSDLKNVVVSQELLEETQFSPFFCLLLSTVVMKANIVLYIDEEANAGMIDLDTMRSNPITGVVLAYDMLNNPSLTAINLTSIVTELNKTVDITTKWLVSLRAK
jgi:hypothetical protein